MLGMLSELMPGTIWLDDSDDKYEKKRIKTLSNFAGSTFHFHIVWVQQYYSTFIHSTTYVFTTHIHTWITLITEPDVQVRGL